MSKSKIVALTSLVLVIVLALLCGLVFTMGNNSHNDALAEDTHAGHSYDDGWEDLNYLGVIPVPTYGELSSGKYYLTSDLAIGFIPVNNFIVKEGEVVTVCLNGYQLTPNTGKTPVFQVKDGATLIIEDCNSSGTALGGSITGANTAISLEGSATLIINGGTIKGIKDKTAVDVGLGTFIMNGGLITDCTTPVSVANGNVTINGGTISNPSGSAITMDNGAFYMNNGKVAGTISNVSGSSYITGGQFATANVETNKVGTTPEGTDGVGVLAGYVVTANEGNAEYPYIVQLSTQRPSTVYHNGTSGWYKMSEWIAQVGNVLLDGKYYLDEDIQLTSQLTINGNVTLCLNGNVLSTTVDQSVISVMNDAQLTLEDCNTTAKNLYYIDESGAFVFGDETDSAWLEAYNTAEEGKKGSIASGVVTGGNASYGGGVYVSEKASFTMTGGAIVGNTATQNGGGVYANGAFAMEGGTISGNTATQNGGGVYSVTSFELNDGTISGNTATEDGGAVCAEGTFTMISGNLSANNAKNGGGVCVNWLPGSSFTMSGGSITDNTATEKGGGVCAYSSATFTLNDGTIANNTATGGASIYVDRANVLINGGKVSGTLHVETGYGKTFAITGGYFAEGDVEADTVYGCGVSFGYEVVANNGEDKETYPFVVQAKQLQSYTHDGSDGWYKLDEYLALFGGDTIYTGKYFLDKDMTLSTRLNIIGEVTLCLNGHILRNGGTESVINGYIDFVFILQDCNSKMLQHNYYVDSSTGVWKVDDNTPEWQQAYTEAAEKGTITGGVITGGHDEYVGGGVQAERGTFIMQGGTIAGNISDNSGGGVNFSSDYEGKHYFRMEGGTIAGNVGAEGGGLNVDSGTNEIIDGTIRDNISTTHGGGVYLYGGTLTISGGNIVNNKATSGGGGVCLASGVLIVTGGTFANNTANQGGAIYISWSSATIIDGTITGNTATTNGGGVYVIAEKTLTVQGGTISGNTSSGEGAGVYTETGAIFTMDGGEISGNTSSASGSDLYSNGSNTFNGGKVEDWVINSGTSTINGGYFTVADTSANTVNGIEVPLGYRVYANDDEYKETYPYVVKKVELSTYTHDNSDGWYNLNEYISGMSSTTLVDGKYFVDGENLTLTQSLVITGEVTLCLNGYVIELNGVNLVTLGEGANLTLQDCSSGQSGAITGGSAENGGAINVGTGATFTMEGGTISGNTATANGGAVYVAGTFTMNGGTISGNTATTNGDGIYLSGTFTMNGGTIANTASEEDVAVGLYIDGAGAKATIVSGYYKDNISNNGGSITISGGYFAVGDQPGNSIAGITFELTELVVVQLTEGEAVELGYTYTINPEISIEVSVETVTYDGGVVENLTDFTITVTVSGQASTAYDSYVYQYAVKDTTDFITGLPVNAGTYTIKVIFTLREGITAEKDFDLTIDKATLTVTAVDREYDGTANIALGLSGVVGQDDVALSVTTGTIEDINVGDGKAVTVDQSIALVGNQAGNYQLQPVADLLVNIATKKLTVNWTGSQFEYNGTVQLPTATVETGIDGESINLVVTSDGGKFKGEYNATAAMEGDNPNYELVGTGFTYNVVAKQLTVNWGTVEFVYNGQMQVPTATVDTGIDGETISLLLDAVDSKNCGTYSITATMQVPNTNYELLGAQTQYTIVAKQLSVTWSDSEFTYNGQVQHPTATIDTGIDGETIDFVVLVDETVNADTYSATVFIANLSGNYTVSGTTLQYTILPYAVTVTWTGTQFGYDGKVHAPTATAVDLNGESLQVVVSGAQASAGSHTATANIANGNYVADSQSLTCDYTITPKTVSVVWGSTEFTYNGQVQKPTATVDTGIAGESVAITVSVEGGINAGSYTATATTSNGNYTLTNVSCEYTIAKATIAVVWGQTSFVYSGEAVAPTATAVGADGKLITLTVTGAQTEVGTYTATASIDDANYTLTNTTVEFTITAVPVNVGLIITIIGGVVLVQAVVVTVIFIKKKKKA